MRENIGVQYPQGERRQYQVLQGNESDLQDAPRTSVSNFPIRQKLLIGNTMIVEHNLLHVTATKELKSIWESPTSFGTSLRWR